MLIVTAPFLVIDQSLLWLDNRGLQGLTTIVVLSLAGMVILLRCVVGFLDALRDY